MRLWAQIDLAVDAPLNPDKPTNEMQLYVFLGPVYVRSNAVRVPGSCVPPGSVFRRPTIWVRAGGASPVTPSKHTQQVSQSTLSRGLL